MRGTIQYSSLVKYYVQGFTVVNASNTASHTITITTTNTLGLSGSGVYLLEYSGQDAAAPYDTAAGATGIDNTLPTVSISTSVANEYLIFAGVFGASLTGGTGVTIQISNTGTWYQRGGDKLAASSGSNTFAMSGNATTGWVLHGVAIKPAGGVGTTPLTFTGSDSLAGGELL
jgi:hypothetical protein